MRRVCCKEKPPAFTAGGFFLTDPALETVRVCLEGFFKETERLGLT
jgi:hypothetical protein